MAVVLDNNSAKPRAATLLCFAVACLLFPPVSVPAEAQAGLRTHAPIVIEGDLDLCDDKETAAGVDADGIINCESADGTAAAPYLIRGWRIVHDDPACSVGDSGTCTPLPTCSVASLRAALSICNTTKHILLDQLSVEVYQGAQRLQPGPSLVAPVSAITIAGSSHLTLRWVNVSSNGLALSVEEGRSGGRELEAQDIRFENSTFRSLASSAAAGTTAVFEPLVQIIDADVILERVKIDSLDRPHALRAFPAQDLGESPPHHLQVLHSTIVGALETGLDVSGGYSSLLHGNQFERAGLPSPPQPEGRTVQARNVRLDEGHHIVTNNLFLVTSTGLQLETVSGRAQYNEFSRAAGSSDESAALFQPTDSCSDFRLTYNDIHDLLVHNQERGCTLQVPHNYWSGGSATVGEVDREPLLPLPIKSLPRVEVHRPARGDGVHGKFIVTGNATSREGGDLVRVEASDVEDVWRANVTAEGTSPWLITWDAGGAPLGPLNLWIRACGSVACGVPAQLTLEVVERPLPPIALLQAAPRVVRAGEVVRLDGSESYSPQARPITAYRFDLGNGIRTDWLPSSVYEIRFTQPGEYPTSLEVMDASGLQNNNLPQAIVRVRSDEPNGRLEAIPNVSFLPLAALLVALSAWRRSR